MRRAGLPPSEQSTPTPRYTDCPFTPWALPQSDWCRNPSSTSKQSCGEESRAVTGKQALFRPSSCCGLGKHSAAGGGITKPGSVWRFSEDQLDLALPEEAASLVFCFTGSSWPCLLWLLVVIEHAAAAAAFRKQLPMYLAGFPVFLHLIFTSGEFSSNWHQWILDMST